MNPNISIYYFFSFFKAFAPAYAIERIFWTERGMTIPLTIATEILYGFLTLLLELPSGIWSDRYGHKRLIFIGSFISFLEFALLLCAHGPLLFFLVIILSSFGNACSSGSINALLYESLVQTHDEAQFEKILGKGQTIYWFSISCSSILGGIIAEFFNLELCYIISASCMFFSLLSAFCFKNTNQSVSCTDASKEQQSPSFSKYLKDCLAFIHEQPQLRHLVLVYTFLGASMIYLEEFWQLLLAQFNLPYFYFGVFLSLFGLLRIPGESLAYLVKTHFVKLLKVSPLLYALGYWIMAHSQSVVCFMTMLVLSSLTGLLEPLMFGYLHHQAAPSMRATLESSMTLLLRGASILTGLLFGLASRQGVSTGFIYLSIFCLLVFITEKIYRRDQTISL